MNNKKWIFAILALVLVVAALAGIYFATRPSTTDGAKTITVTVVHKDTAATKTFVYVTEEEYLGPVLVAEGLIPEGNIQSGMFDTVDGETAVWAEDEGWWAVYQGDNMAVVGINELVIADGDTFRLVYTNGFAS